MIKREADGRHHSSENPRDPGFCECGLALTAWVHTDSTYYRAVPLTEWSTPDEPEVDRGGEQ